MRSLRDRFKDMLAVPSMFPVAKNAVILDASYLPMTTQGILFRADTNEATQTVEFNHCVITFELDNGIQGTLLETGRVENLPDIDADATNALTDAVPNTAQYQKRIPGETIQVFQDFRSGSYSLVD